MDTQVYFKINLEYNVKMYILAVDKISWLTRMLVVTCTSELQQDALGETEAKWVVI